MTSTFHDGGPTTFGSGWDEYARGVVLVASLERDAVRVMDHLPQGPVSVTAQKLREMFVPEVCVVSHHTRFEMRTRGSNESAESFILELRNLSAKAFPKKSSEDCEEMVLRKLLSGEPYNIRYEIGAVCYQTLTQAMAGVLHSEVLVSKRPDPQHRG